MNYLIEILNLISMLFDAIFAFLIVKSVISDKPGIRSKILFGIIFIPSVLFVNWFNPSANPFAEGLMASMGENAYSVIRQLFYVITVLILASVAFHGTIIVKLFASVLYNVILEVGEIFTYGIVLLFFPDYLHAECVNQDAIYLFGFFTSYIYYIAVLIIMRNFPTRSIGTLSLRQGAILIATPTICAVVIGILIAYLKSDVNANYLLYLVPSLFFILLLFFIVAFFKNHVKSEEQAKDKAVLSSQIDGFAEQYEALEAANTSLRNFRHDWNNHLTVMRGIAETGDMKKLTNYIKEIENSAPAVPVAFTDNVVIDALLSGLERKTQQCGIDFSVKAIRPLDINIRMADLCVLVANALDNAYEACLKMKNVPKWINVRFSYKDGHLFFSVENSYETVIAQKDGHMITNKSNIELHGIGIRNMNSIADKYGGHISLEFNENIFVLKCILADQLTD